MISFQNVISPMRNLRGKPACAWKPDIRSDTGFNWHASFAALSHSQSNSGRQRQ
jgi:hypothetical protein